MSGESLEDQIEVAFRARGVEVLPAREWREARMYETPGLSAVIQNVPYVSIYGHDARIEFLFLHRGRQILIEAKRQESSGSTDEKLPYVFANAEANIAQGREFLLILEGEGWKRGARKWISDKAEQTDGFSVITSEAFEAWLDRQLGSD